MVQNPDVTVRNRGVMEKCTYCVQRIREAQGTAETEGRPIREGEVMPACAAACPTHAISFGNLNDQAAEVNALEGAAAELCAAGRAEHPAAHDVPGRAAEPEPGDLEERRWTQKPGFDRS